MLLGTSPQEIIEEVILRGNKEQKKILFNFNSENTNEEILKKFQLFTQSQYIRYFKGTPAPFHNEMVLNLIRSYRGERNINIAFRGSAKTTLTKLFVVFVLLNDTDKYRKYLKVLSRDIKNPKQIVTDVFNLCLELRHIYGDVFEREGDKKREETMSSFTMKSGVKFTAGTVGQSQRGHAQDAYRPDWIWFDDIEDRESASSTVITEGIISRIDEAITGLSKGGSWTVTGNYISEYGSIQWFLNKENTIKQITPITVNNIPTWSIYTLAEVEIFKKDSEDFFGEYMCDPTRSEGKFFNLDKIDEDLKKCKPASLKIGDTKYWFPYLSHHRYGIGADTSEGVGLDSNALALFDFTTGDLVATNHSNTIKPELFAYELKRVGTEFGECVIAPEINNMSGGIVIVTLKNMYQNIFRATDRSKVNDVETQKLGWHTNARTKPQMFMDFRRDYNDGIVHIYDEQVLKEMKSYSNTDISDAKSQTTRHFDLLTSVVIAWQMKNELKDKNVATVFYPNL
jgi:hypothetical protein